MVKIKDDPLIWDDLGMFGECYPKFGMAIYKYPSFFHVWGLFGMAILRYLYIAIPTTGRFSCFPDDLWNRDRLAGWNRFGLLGQRSAATWMNGGFANTQGDDLFEHPSG